MASVPAVAAGQHVRRGCGCTSSDVASSCGDDVGMMLMIAVSPFSLRIGPLTVATPSVVASASRTSTAVVVSPAGSSMTAFSVPEKPGAEALGEQLVGLAGRRALGLVAVVGEADAHAQHRARPRARSTQRLPTA